MLEIELSFLAKAIPIGLEKCEKKEIIDIYIPKEARHCFLRIRKNGNKFEITNKLPTEDNDPSHYNEYTVKITEAEFNALSKVDGRRIHKTRYLYPYKGRIAEIDVFHGALKGLVVVEFEFESKEEKDNFEMPDFCLADVTPEEFIAGGFICGKTYEDIKHNLNKYNYKRILI